MDAHDNEHFITVIGNHADELARLPGQDKADRAVRHADEIKQAAAELASRAGPPSDQSDEVIKLTAYLEQADKDVAGYKADIETRDAEILRLQGVEADMQTVIESRDAEITNLRDEIAGQANTIDGLEFQLAGLNTTNVAEPAAEAVETPVTVSTAGDQPALVEEDHF